MIEGGRINKFIKCIGSKMHYHKLSIYIFVWANILALQNNAEREAAMQKKHSTN